VRKADLNYELLTVGLQCLWICGIWCLLESLEVAAVTRRRALGLLIFSGFLFYNSTYTWPKLLAATYILFVFAIALEAIRAKRRVTYLECSLGGSCLGLAMVAHPGSIFSLVGLAVLIVRFRSLLSIRQAVLGVLVVAAYLAPWKAYQKWVDPPGNRLFKMHMAGEHDWMRGRPGKVLSMHIKVIRFVQLCVTSGQTWCCWEGENRSMRSE
jgi:hypothetical protein